jgi:hypothetical protein
MSDLDTPSNPGHLPARKRVVAREVEAANRESAALTPEVISPPVPRPIDEPAAVVDPTQLGRRYRKPGHLKVYRCTQAFTMLCVALSVGGILWTLLAEDVHIGRILPGAGIVVGLAASILSGFNSLAARWRGWAIAATVFAGVVLGLTMLHDRLADDSIGPVKRAREFRPE